MNFFSSKAHEDLRYAPAGVLTGWKIDQSDVELWENNKMSHNYQC